MFDCDFLQVGVPILIEQDFFFSVWVIRFHYLLYWLLEPRLIHQIELISRLYDTLVLVSVLYFDLHADLVNFTQRVFNCNRLAFFSFGWSCCLRWFSLRFLLGPFELLILLEKFSIVNLEDWWTEAWPLSRCSFGYVCGFDLSCKYLNVCVLLLDYFIARQLDEVSFWNQPVKDSY